MIDTSLTSSNFYFLLAVFQGFILSFIILSLQPKTKPNIYFCVLLFLFSLGLLQSVLESSIHAFNSKYPIPMSFRMAFGPLAYLHIQHIKDPVRSFKSKDLLHFIPSLIFDVIIFTASFLYIRANIDWAMDHIPFIQSIALYVAFIVIIQLGVYTYLIYKESRDTTQVLKEFKEVKKWLNILVIGWCIPIGLHIIGIPIGLIFIEQLDDNSEWMYVPLGAISVIYIFVLGYSYLLRHYKSIGIYMDKIKKFKFTSDELVDKKNDLLTALDQERLYTDPRLTVAKLAGHLGWPINSVSKIINDTLQTNFNDLVNQHRVDA